MKNNIPSRILKKNTAHWILAGIFSTLGLSLFLTTQAIGLLPEVSLLPVAITSLFLSIALEAPSYLAAFKELFRTKNLSMNYQLVMNGFLTVMLSFIAVFVPELPSMFDAGLLLLGFRHLGLALQDTIEKRMPISTITRSYVKTSLETKLGKLLGYAKKSIDLINLTSCVLGILFISPYIGVELFITLLIVSYPYTLSLITPFALRLGVQKLRSYPYNLVLQPKVLAQLNQINTLVFYLDEALNKQQLNCLKNTLKQLTLIGKSYSICILADEESATILAEKLQITADTIYPNCLSNKKDIDEGQRVTLHQHVSDYKKKGKVALIGNTCYESAILADFYASFKTIQSEQQNVLPQFNALIAAFEVALHTEKNIKENLILSAFCNLSFIIVPIILSFGFGISVKPVMGIFLIMLEVGILALNSYRFHKRALPNYLISQTLEPSHKVMQEVLHPGQHPRPELVLDYKKEEELQFAHPFKIKPKESKAQGLTPLAT